MIKWIRNWIEGIARENLKEYIKSCENHTNWREQSEKEFKKNITNLKTCETCGCLISPDHAVKGKSVIDSVLCQDYIHIPYYCKVHAPKVESDFEKYATAAQKNLQDILETSSKWALGVEEQTDRSIIEAQQKEIRQLKDRVAIQEKIIEKQIIEILTIQAVKEKATKKGKK